MTNADGANHTDPERPRSVAYHEAAHAVSACRFDILCHVVTIVPAEDYLGIARGMGDWYSEKEAEQFLVNLLAGYAAALHLGVDSRPDVGASEDFESADSIIQRLHPEATTDADVEAIREKWVNEAMEFVRDDRNWRAIEAVADELLRHETLAGDELRLIIAASDGDDGSRRALEHLRLLVRGDT